MSTGSLAKLTEVIRIKVIQLSLCFRTPSVSNCCQLLPIVAKCCICCQVLLGVAKWCQVFFFHLSLSFEMPVAWLLDKIIQVMRINSWVCFKILCVSRRQVLPIVAKCFQLLQTKIPHSQIYYHKISFQNCI